MIAIHRLSPPPSVIMAEMLYNTRRPSNLRIQESERAREFKYLGSSLTEDNNISIEIKLRIVMANRASYGLQKQLS
jgi:hypothetical protein